MNKPELDVRIMGEWDPQELERRIKEFKKENIVEFSQFQPVAIKDEKGKDGVFFTIAMFFEMKNDPEKRDWAIPASMRAVSKFMLDLAFTARAAEQIEDD